MSTISNSDESSPRWDQFFEGLHFRLDLLARYRQQTNRLLAQDFNVFAYIAPGENRLSDMLVDLLDPAGTHGQGTTFLNRFLAMLEKQCGNHSGSILSQISAAVQNGSPVAVSRELPTSFIAAGMRRMDIVVGVGKLGMMIENKPWTLDQVGQLADYAADLVKRFPDGSMLVYLSGTGEPPAKSSLPDDVREKLMQSGRYCEIAYSTDLAMWLEQCIHDCEADKVRWFLRDFQEYVQQQFELMPEGNDSVGEQ